MVPEAMLPRSAAWMMVWNFWFDQVVPRLASGGESR